MRAEPFVTAGKWRLTACLLVPIAAQSAGLIVYRTDQGIQFADAASIAINGKDKVLSLGEKPVIGAPLNKLSSVKLGPTMLKDGDASTPAFYDAAQTRYVLPEGLEKGATGAPGALWKTAAITYKKTTSDKTPTTLPAGTFVAYLPGGLEELTRLAMDERALELVGGKTKGFAAQIELLSATIKAYGSNPATAPLRKYVEDAMRQPYENFENGLAGVEALERALKVVELSQAAFASDQQQRELRAKVTERKAWLDRKIAVLRALNAASQWDAFLVGERDFERYEQSFPPIAKMHLESLKQSLEMHRKTAEERMKDGEFGAAYREFRLASARQPSNEQLRNRAAEAWTDYSNRVARDNQSKRKQLTVGARGQMQQKLDLAARYKADNKLDEAFKSVQEAESYDPDAIAVLLKKAEILGAQNEIDKALKTLDQLDLRAVDEERTPANNLRSELSYQLGKLKDAKTAMEKAWAEQKYHLARQLALKSLKAKDDDPDILYTAAMASLVTRNAADARTFLARYLEVSNTLDANPEQRARVRRILPTLTAQAAAAPEQGEANWMSGKKLPKNVYYDPASLAFQGRIARIEASNKLNVAFEWKGPRLAAIVPTFDKGEHITPEKKIVFGYDEKTGQVAWTGYETETYSPGNADEDESVRRSALVTSNNPYIDPLMVEKITGKNIAAGIAGNRFFNPFVWEKVYAFRFKYDELGRVAQARELGERGEPGATLVEFTWNGMQLAAVRAYTVTGPDEKSRGLIYSRTMQYQGGLLAAEDIETQGKSAHIKYVYSGDALVSAKCDKDPSVDGRERQVTFLPGR